MLTFIVLSAIFGKIYMNFFKIRVLIFSIVDFESSVRAIIFEGDSKYPDTFFFVTYITSIVSASFGLAKCLKVLCEKIIVYFQKIMLIKRLVWQDALVRMVL